MTKHEAKRLVCRCAARLLDMGHENEFVYFDQNGEELSHEDASRMREALEDLVAELSRRGRLGVGGRC